jgi:DNA-binding MarR family transcriptional regulator
MPIETQHGRGVDYLLRRCFQRSDAVFIAAWQQVGLAPNEYRLLSTIAKDERNYNQRTLAAVLNLSQNVIVYMVKDLAERGLVEQKINQWNRREKFVRLTKQGRKQLEAAYEINRQIQERLLSHFSPKDQRELFRLLQLFLAKPQ